MEENLGGNWGRGCSSINDDIGLIKRSIGEWRRILVVTGGGGMFINYR